MAKTRWLQVLLLVLSSASPVAAGSSECDAYASQDRPELAAPGSFAVGRRALPLAGPPPLPGDSSGATQRSLRLLVWYPAALTNCSGAAPYRETLFNHPWRRFATDQVSFNVASTATPEAAPVDGRSHPLVVLSHGLLGWASGLSYLGEHLASRGYIVAGIDHHDEQAADPLKSAIALRPLDQAAAIDALRKAAQESGHWLAGRIDLERIAIVGYSMGGYGALKSAALQDTTMRGLRSVVAITPWGGQSQIGIIDRAALAKVTLPLLFIVGDKDDVSGFEDGVATLFRNASGSERWLLTYQNARHNVGGYPLPVLEGGVPARQSFFLDSVWRTDRIQAVNRHFVTAFLDLTLQDETSRRAYLQPATPRSNDGEWPVAPFADTGDTVADDKIAPRFWRGFQRRAALGLELQHLKPAAAGGNN